jgi:hypothetical protein
MGICFHWCIYKVVFSLYLSRLTTYLPIYVFYLPNLAYQPIYLYVYRLDIDLSSLGYLFTYHKLPIY